MQDTSAIQVLRLCLPNHCLHYPKPEEPGQLFQLTGQEPVISSPVIPQDGNRMVYWWWVRRGVAHSWHLCRVTKNHVINGQHLTGSQESGRWLYLWSGNWFLQEGKATLSLDHHPICAQWANGHRTVFMVGLSMDLWSSSKVGSKAGRSPVIMSWPLQMP